MASPRPAPRPSTIEFDAPLGAGHLAAMRRNAVFDLFALAKLGPPPALVWAFIGDDDVGRGVDDFLRATGADVNRQRLQALLRAEAGLRRADGKARAAWLADLLSGDAARFSAAAQAARHYAEPQLADYWPAELVPAPASFATIDLAVELAEHAAHRQTLLGHWPDAWTDADEGEQVRSHIAAFEAAEVAALPAVSAGASLDHVLTRLRSENAGLARLSFLAASTATAVGVVGAAPDTSAITMANDQAAAFARWADLRWRHHPDRPGLPNSERADRRRRCAAIDRALDRREQLLRAGTP